MKASIALIILKKSIRMTRIVQVREQSTFEAHFLVMLEMKGHLPNEVNLPKQASNQLILVLNIILIFTNLSFILSSDESTGKYLSVVLWEKQSNTSFYNIFFDLCILHLLVSTPQSGSATGAWCNMLYHQSCCMEIDQARR